MITLWLFTIAPIAMENQFDDLAIELSNHWFFFQFANELNCQRVTHQS